VVTWSKRAFVKLSSAPVWGLAFSPDGRTLAAGCGDARVRLWDPVTGQLLLVLDGHTQRVNTVAFSPDGRSLASASHDGAIRLWQAGYRDQAVVHIPRSEQSPEEEDGAVWNAMMDSGVANDTPRTSSLLKERSFEK
jgi:WD40 repeat protein